MLRMKSYLQKSSKLNNYICNNMYSLIAISFYKMAKSDIIKVKVVNLNMKTIQIAPCITDTQSFFFHMYIRNLPKVTRQLF